MPNCVNYDCQDALGIYNEAQCGIELAGGSNQAIFLECNHQLTDPSDATAVQAEIDAGRATLVTGASFSIEAPSPVTADSLVPCRPASVSNYNRTGNYINPNVTAENVLFHQPIFKGRKFGGIILYECGAADDVDGGQVTWIDNTVTFTGGRILPASQTEKQRFEGQFAWVSKLDPEIYPAPAGIFS